MPSNDDGRRGAWHRASRETSLSVDLHYTQRLQSPININIHKQYKTTYVRKPVISRSADRAKLVAFSRIADIAAAVRRAARGVARAVAVAEARRARDVGNALAPGAVVARQATAIQLSTTHGT